MTNRKRLAKKKKREKEAHKRVLQRRKYIREQAKLEKEIEDLKWENRDRLTPIRKHKEVD